jgi:hypothetical protein
MLDGGGTMSHLILGALNNVRTSDMPWARQISPPRFMADGVR